MHDSMFYISRNSPQHITCEPARHLNRLWPLSMGNDPIIPPPSPNSTRNDLSVWKRSRILGINHGGVNVHTMGNIEFFWVHVAFLKEEISTKIACSGDMLYVAWRGKLTPRRSPDCGIASNLKSYKMKLHFEWEGKVCSCDKRPKKKIPRLCSFITV